MYNRREVTDGVTVMNKDLYDNLQDGIDELDNRIRDVELFKFPNAVIIGEPTINNGQISGFSSDNYLQFPYVVTFDGRPFEINTEITTGNNISTAQKIFDCNFGFSVGIDGGRFLLAISSNGTSWDIVNQTGDFDVKANTTHKIKISWDGDEYKLSVSIDGGESYTDDIVVSSQLSPNPSQVFIGIRHDLTSPFLGIINLNRSSLLINSVLEWQGMDDVGIASRLDRDMSNLNPAGEKKVKDLVIESDIKLSQGRNLIPYPYFRKDTYTHNGVTYVINPTDGTVTANGTAVGGNSTCDLIQRSASVNFRLEDEKDYTLSGCPSGGGNYRLCINATKSDGSVLAIPRDTGEGSTFIYKESEHRYLGMFIEIVNGTTVNNLVFKPMLEKGIVRHEYEPTTQSGVTIAGAIKELKNDIDLKILLDGKPVTSVSLRYAGMYNKKISNLPFTKPQLGNQGAVIYNNMLHLVHETGLYKWNGSSWDKLSDNLYDGSYQGRAVVYNNQIHYISGMRGGHYKWNGSSWSGGLEVAPGDLQFSSYIVYNNAIHAFAGYTTNHYKFNGSSWSKVGTFPIDGLNNAGAVVYNNEIHVFCNTDHYKFNGSSWSKVSTIPADFYRGCAVVYNNEVHLLGSDNTYHYIWNGSSWSKGNDLPHSSTYPAAVVYNGDIHMMLVTGGADYYIITKKYYNVELP